jgi:hypothetical protein
MRENGLDFRYILLESYDVDSIDEQRQKEQIWIDRLKPDLNSKRAYSTEEDYKNMRKQYRDNNPEKVKKHKQDYYKKYKEEIKIKKKQYREDNKDHCLELQRESYHRTKDLESRKSKYIEKYRERRLITNKMKVTCECEEVVTKTNLKRHMKSAKHVKKINLYYLNQLPLC